MAPIVASKILQVQQGKSGQRFRLIVQVGDAEQIVDLPISDLLERLPQLNAMSQKPDGMGRVLLSLADHGTALLPDGKALLSLQTAEGWTVSYEVEPAQLGALRSSLANLATAQAAPQTRN